MVNKIGKVIGEIMTQTGLTTIKKSLAMTTDFLESFSLVSMTI